MKKLWILLCCLLPVVSKAQIITTYAGNGINSTTGDGTPATSASVSSPTGVAFDSRGNLYIASYSGEKIRKVDFSTGVISTYAGTGSGGFSGDGGPAISAQIHWPTYMAVDDSDNLYFSDAGNQRIRKINALTGIIQTIAGNGTCSYSGDGGLAISSGICSPYGLAFDSYYNLFFADRANNVIRKINTSGIITTVAGNNIIGFSGDGGPATNAQLRLPTSVAIDSLNNIYIADFPNQRIRRVDSVTGIITTVVGDGSGSYNGEGIVATSAGINPWDIKFDTKGNLYIADYGNQRTRKVDTNLIVTTIAGNGISGYSGDGGAATLAQLYNPEGIAIDVCGNIYISDDANHRIRKVTTDSPIISTPTIALSGGTSFPLGSTVPVTAVVSGAGSSYIIYWMNHGITFTSTTVPSVTYTKGPGIDTITAKVVSTAAYGCFDSTTSSGHIVSVGTVGITTNVSVPLYIYPNPTNHLLHIDNLQTNAGYRILSIVGAAIQHGLLHTGSNELNIRDLPPGMYLLEVNEQGKRTIQKIVKE